MIKYLIIIIFISFSAYGFDPLADFQFAPEQPKENDSRFGGYLEYSARYAPKSGKLIQNRGKVFLEADYEKERLFFYASAYAYYDSAPEDWQGDTEILRLYEAYARYNIERLDITAGNMMLRWGTGDGINPMDILNPRDHLNPVAGARTDSRLPATMVQTVYAGDFFTVEAVFIPFAEVNELPEQGSPWENRSLNELRKNVRVESENKPDGTEGAARIYTTYNGWDAALLYYGGYADEPLLKYRNGSILPVYERIKAYGFNFAKGLSNGTLRGELAHKEGSFYGSGYTIGVIGFDRNFDSDGYLNIQLFTDSEGKEGRGFTYEASDKYFNGDLKAGFRGTHYGDDSGGFEVFSEYYYADGFTLKSGIMLIYGKPSTVWGQYSDNDYVYTEFKFSF